MEVARQQPADHLLPEVLTRPEFVQACVNRDLGAVFRLAKQWGGVGFTSSHLARRCELTVSRVQDYISGRVRAQSVEVFERVADGLHIPGGMLDLAPRSWEVVATIGTETTSQDGDDSVLRREFMKLSAGVAATTLTTNVPAVPARTTGNRIGSSTVAELRGNIVRLRHLDDHLGGADTYRLYRAEVDKTATLLRNAGFSTATQRELLALLAEQAQQAGWAAFDAGWHDDARRLYKRSYTAAKEANSGELVGNALALRSYQLLTTGSLADAVNLADQSCRYATESDFPEVRSLLFQRAAWTFAVAGNAEQATRVLGRAEVALTIGESGHLAPDWAAWAHSSTELQIIAGRCWTQLHRPLRAVPALESAMADYDDSHARDKALYLSWLADAYIDAGEVEHASAALGRALDLSANVASARPQRRVAEVAGRLRDDYADAPAVAELLARGPHNPVQVRR